jgi:hypothetical protein
MALWYILWPFYQFYGPLVYFMAILSILWPFGIFHGHSVNFTAIWYILWPFCQFYGHLIYHKAIWYILRPFGIFYGHLVYFPRFGMLHPDKSGNPDNDDLAGQRTFCSKVLFSKVLIQELLQLHDL